MKKNEDKHENKGKRERRKKKKFNSSFRPLTFTKLQFWSPKKTTKSSPKFCNCSSFGPPRQKNTRGVDRVKIGLGGQNLGAVL